MYNTVLRLIVCNFGNICLTETYEQVRWVPWRLFSIKFYCPFSNLSPVTVPYIYTANGLLFNPDLNSMFHNRDQKSPFMLIDNDNIDNIGQESVQVKGC